VAAGVAATAGATGRFLLRRRFDVAASREAVRLPVAASPARAIPAAASVAVPGVTPFVTANRDFYRVDTALVLPQLSTEDWRLRIHGLVDREIELDFAELQSRPVVERDITLTCVSNEVGGRLAGTARWLGTPLADLLNEAGVRRGADQLLSRSVDGMTIGTPVAAVLDGRDALLAYGMNGEPLPVEHGFPVRMIVPGLYGYVSATKWVVDLELTRYTDVDAYWTKRKWARVAPIKTFSRIDAPKPLAQVRPGRTAVAGVAWAQHRGIRAVEVRVDDGPWQQARLAADAGIDLWRSGCGSGTPRPGRTGSEVRATDATGATQPDRRARPFPDGATGWALNRGHRRVTARPSRPGAGDRPYDPGELREHFHDRPPAPPHRRRLARRRPRPLAERMWRRRHRPDRGHRADDRAVVVVAHDQRVAVVVAVGVDRCRFR
jgi:DMSO/TMAO reductase YedYZ molybdopterin-dependent catalytic subunit